MSGHAQPGERRSPVHILLSTYNGEAFLRAQLASFETQTHAAWVLYWRDDGSTDRTVDIMREFAARLGPQRCIESASSGPHLGACESFLTLLAECADADAVAFADQDDFWLPGKLAAAMEHLAAATGPVLYCARQYLVNGALGGAKLSARHRRTAGFPASLTQNIATGNTLVLNGAAARLVTLMGRPLGTVHDWWSYIVVSACGGRIIFDDRPQVLYRLHENNLIGSAKPLPARALAALRRGPAIFMTMMRRHAENLMAQINQLAPQARQDLKLIHTALHGGMPARLAALRCRRFRRRTVLENLLFGFWFVSDGRAEARANGECERLPHWAQNRRPAAE